MKYLTLLVLCFLLVFTTVGITVNAATVTLFTDSGNNRNYSYMRDGKTGVGDYYDAKTDPADAGNKCLTLISKNGTAFMVAQGSAAVAYKKGYTYTVTWKMKADSNRKGYMFFFDGSGTAASPTVTTAPQVNGQYNWASQTGVDLTTSWNSFSYTFTVKDIKGGAASSSEPKLAFRLNGTGTLYVDDVSVAETPCFNVSVSAGENGSVSMNGAAVPSQFMITEGETVSLKLVPDEGYEAKATVNGAVYEAVNNEINLTVTQDMNINVTFEKTEQVSPGVVHSESWFRNVDGVPTIYTYHQINTFNTGETQEEYGVKLTDAAYPGISLSLPAMKKTGDAYEKDYAVPGKQFAVKMYGNAIVSGHTYSVQPYVGEISGSEYTVTFEQ